MKYFLYHIHATVQGKIIISILLLVLLLSVVVYATDIKLFIYEWEIKNHFNNWDDSPYNSSSFNCRHMSFLVEEYWETVKGFNCFFVYGDKGRHTINWSSHIWVIVEIDDVFYEFESTSLKFKSVSDEYDIHDVSHGFYVDGVKFEKCQSFDSWEYVFERFLK